ncbi:MAG: ATP-binding protein [Desulfarculus sp.]|nr:MAG: ATP-binding protein [Desulfarculus sp.]
MAKGGARAQGPGRGQKALGRLSLPAQLGSLPAVMELVQAAADRAGLGEREAREVLLAAEEAAVNIISHAYPQSKGELRLTCRLPAPGLLELVFSDQGLPFNPLAHAEPEPAAGLAGRRIGGLGLRLIKRSVDLAVYCRQGGRNVLTLRKEKGKRQRP